MRQYIKALAQTLAALYLLVEALPKFHIAKATLPLDFINYMVVALIVGYLAYRNWTKPLPLPPDPPTEMSLAMKAYQQTPTPQGAAHIKQLLEKGEK